MTNNVAILNRSSVLTDQDVSAAVADLGSQVLGDFSPAWGIQAQLQFIPTGGIAPSGSWEIDILDVSDVPGAAGYHQLTAEGLPLGKVFAKTDQQNGLSWTVTLSHELLEMLADPDVNLTAQDPQARGFVAYEVGDPVENDSYGYMVGNTRVSDFVFPAYFESFRKPGSTQFDKQNIVTQPFEIAKQGYLSIFEYKRGKWTQLSGPELNPKYRKPRGRASEKQKPEK